MTIDEELLKHLAAVRKSVGKSKYFREIAKAVEDEGTVYYYDKEDMIVAMMTVEERDRLIGEPDDD